MKSMKLFAVDQQHGIRPHHDWWWNLTVPQAIVIAAVIAGLVAWYAIHAWFEVKDDELHQRRVEWRVSEGIN